MTETHLTATPEDRGERIDQFVSRVLQMTRSSVQKRMEQGDIRVNGQPVPKNARLSGDETVEVLLPLPVPLEAQAEDIELDIVYEDPHLLVVNKPKGMVVHPAPGHPTGTLVNALLSHCKGRLSGINGVVRPGIVHRLDKDTSGLLIVAKTDAAHQHLARQISEHSFHRQYEAVLYGRLREPSGRVDAPIGRHPVDRKKMAVTDKHSRPAVTHYQVLEEFPGFSYVQLRLETGRTHQIRVHMAYLGHPVAGDTVYSHQKPPAGLQGQCLHARQIGFIHPVSGEYMTFDSPLPAYFMQFLDTLRRMARVT